MSEVEDTLRAEIALLRELNKSQEVENNVLRNILSKQAGAKMAGSAPYKQPIVQLGSRERMAMLENTVNVLDGFVNEIAQQDCYDFECDDKNSGSMCLPCQAKAVKEAIHEWRYGGSKEVPSRRFEGAMYSRTQHGWNPRETKMHRAWAGYMERWSLDRFLGLILTDRSGMPADHVIDWPTPRDWYVATSVVQWLGTAVGSQIIEEAGWKYMQYEADRCSIEQHRAEEGSFPRMNDIAEAQKD